MDLPGENPVKALFVGLVAAGIVFTVLGTLAVLSGIRDTFGSH